MMYPQRQSWFRRYGILMLSLVTVALIVGLGIVYIVGYLHSPNNPNQGNQNPTGTVSTTYQGGKQYFPVGAFHVEGSLFVDSTGHKFLLHGAQIPGAFNARKLAGVEIAASQHLDTPTFPL